MTFIILIKLFCTTFAVIMITINNCLDFVDVKILDKHLAEIVVHDGVTFDTAMVDEYHDYLIQNLIAPFNLLVNKKNNYNYDEKAQSLIGNIPQIDKMAVIIYDAGSKLTTEKLQSTPRQINWRLQIFKERKKALKWLKTSVIITNTNHLNDFLRNRTYYSKNERAILKQSIKEII